MWSDEAPHRYVVWPDIRVDTFISFAQFAYTGDYVVTRHEMDGEPPEVGMETETETCSYSVFDSHPNSDTEQVVIIYGQPVETNKKQIFVKRKVYDMMDFNPFSTSPRSNREKYLSMTYSAIFLGHARLYALAAKYNGKSLKHLALGNIKHVLDHYRSYIPHYLGWEDSIVELVNYTFSENVHSVTGLGLRNLVLHFVMAEFDSLGSSKGFIALLKNGGDFAPCFCRELLQKIPRA